VSIQAVAKVMETSTAKGSEYSLLLALANYAGADGTGASPSYKTLANEMRVGSDRTVRYIRDRLLKKGLILQREGKSPYHTDTFDLVYEDGSNREVLAVLHPDWQERKYFPDEEKFSESEKNFPHIIVIDSISDSCGINNNNNSAEKISRCGKSFRDSAEEPASSLQEPEQDTTEVDKLLAEWSEWRVVGEHLRPIAARILRRPAFRQELDAMFAYFEGEKKLKPGWLVKQLRALAELAPEQFSAWEEPVAADDNDNPYDLGGLHMAGITRVEDAGPGLRFLYIRRENGSGGWAIMRGRSIGGDEWDTLDAAVRSEIGRLEGGGDAEAAARLAARFKFNAMSNNGGSND